MFPNNVSMNKGINYSFIFVRSVQGADQRTIKQAYEVLMSGNVSSYI